MPANIRVARPEDVEAIFRIRTSVRENALSIGALAALGITPESVTHMLSGAPCAWVALVEGEIAGFSMVDEGEACLFAVFVSPDREGCGIGRTLTAQAEAALFARHTAIWLETGRDSRATGFYRHLSWTDADDAGPGDIRLIKTS